MGALPAVRIRAWIVPLAAAAMAVALAYYAGAPAAAVAAAVITICAAVLFYRFVRALKRHVELPPEPAPHTSGMTLNWLAPIYDRYCARMGLGIPFRLKTLEYASLRSGDRILDVGCGTGVLTRLAAGAVGPGGSATGLDPSPKMIAVARENALAEKSVAVFLPGVIERLPFEDNSFDAVLSSFMIHHLPPDVKSRGFAEVRRVLKPGGRFLAVDVGKPSNPLWWAVVWPLLLWSFSRDQMRGRLPTFMREAGFEEVRVAGRWKGLVTFWLAFKP